MDKAKNEILGKIRQALSISVPAPFPESIDTGTTIFRSAQDDLEVVFAEEFTKLQGQFSFCLNQQELTSQLVTLAKARNWTKWFCNSENLKQSLENAGFTTQWHQNLSDCQASITTAEALVARTGSLLLSSAESGGGRSSSAYAPVHVCIAYSHQLVWDIADALEMMKTKYGPHLPSFITLASGPSRTADIEKTLVTGVHGPREVFCFLVEQA